MEPLSGMFRMDGDKERVRQKYWLDWYWLDNILPGITYREGKSCKRSEDLNQQAALHSSTQKQNLIKNWKNAPFLYFVLKRSCPYKLRMLKITVWAQVHVLQGDTWRGWERFASVDWFVWVLWVFRAFHFHKTSCFLYGCFDSPHPFQKQENDEVPPLWSLEVGLSKNMSKI